jgi:RNA recognition motif-containing protein
MKLFVNNLAWKTTEEDLKQHFLQAGPVTEAKIVTDRETGRSRGFGFITMADPAAQVAIKTLNQTDLCGRNIFVAEAREKPRDR